MTNLNYVTLLLIFFFLASRVNNVQYAFFFFSIVPDLATFSRVPAQLLVGYNSWHPMLFYVSILSCLFLVLSVFSFVKFKAKSVFALLSLTLILGGYWGLGNSVWGYFWVNDIIELVLLAYIVIAGIFIHTILPRNTSLIIFIASCCIGIFLILLRYGVVFTRHSFFDNKNIKNVTVFVSLIFIQPLISVLFVVIFLIFFNFYFLFYSYLSFSFIRGCTVLEKRVVLLVFHIYVLLASLVWLKSKILSFSLFIKGGGAQGVAKLCIYAIKSGGVFFFLKKTKKLNLFFMGFFTYLPKLVLKAWLIFPSYIFSIWYVICLVFFILLI